MIYTKFKINQVEIIKTICVQRNSNLNTCQGHCALKKSLKALDENEKEMQDKLKEKNELVYLQNTILKSSLNTPNIYLIQHNYSSSEDKPISVKLSNFRPPSFFV